MSNSPPQAQHLKLIKILKANPVAFAVIVVDFNMPDKDGATLIKEISGG
jgi:CheY-like chemotaxis protein